MPNRPDVPRSPTLLIVMDGVGVNPSHAHNAVVLADTPRLDEYFARHPHTTLQASGRAVGLPDGQMGNSEVGHLTLGSGCILGQNLVRIDDAIADRSLFDNPVLLQAAAAARDRNRPLHQIGLFSDGGVHSHVNHLIALIAFCREQGCIPQAHLITDGRDTPPRSAPNYLPLLEKPLQAAAGRVGIVCGRYYAMDRDHRWERTKRAFDALAHGKGYPAADAGSAIRQAYERGEDDEFIQPTLVAGAQPVLPGDSVLFFNFRNDRPRQLTLALGARQFDAFDRGEFSPVRVTTMTEYGTGLTVPVVFKPEEVGTTLAREVSAAGIRQFHCAETEKYAHVTFFFNGGREEPHAGEQRRMLASPKVATYDLKPEMSAAAVADAVIDAVRSGEHGFIVVNFANGDMVGHTAVRESVIKAVEVLDREVGRVLDAAAEAGFSVILTADHGNCDEMVDPVTGTPHTQHTVYPVPCLIMDKDAWRLSVGAGISAIAPTVLQLMGLPKPREMRGQSLLLEQVRR
jgi:2,3-bisphosphoglycerate-independent phosphoglycerate mutase